MVESTYSNPNQIQVNTNRNEIRGKTYGGKDDAAASPQPLYPNLPRSHEGSLGAILWKTDGGELGVGLGYLLVGGVFGGGLRLGLGITSSNLNPQLILI
jgi:hypothetical protein